MNLPFALLAQATTGPTTAPGAQPGPLMQLFGSPMLPILLVIVVMYIFMFRSKNSQNKQRENMLAQLKRGDEVQTIGGEIGKVVEVRPDRVQLKVDESSNAKIWYARSAIHRVIVEDEKAEAK